MQIKYTAQLYSDFLKLTNEFQVFMTLNLTHMDKNPGQSPQCQAKMKELIQYSIDCAKELSKFTENPHLQTDATKIDKLTKNMENMIRFFETYLDYAGPIVNACCTQVKPRFEAIRTAYVNFYSKYLEP